MRSEPTKHNPLVRFLNRHIFLLLSILALCSSLFSYLVLERGAISATDEQYLRTVQERVRQELARSAADLDAVGHHLNEANPAFARLKTETAYPYYIFRNQQLFYWSDHRFIPDYDCLRGLSATRLVTLPQGTFLVSVRQVKTTSGQYEIFSMVDLYRSFQNENNYLRSGYNTSLFSMDPRRIDSRQAQETYHNIFDATPAFLFSVDPPVVDARSQSLPVNSVFSGTLALFFLGIYVFQYILSSARRQKPGLGLLLLLSYLVLLRGVMLYFRVPFLFFEIDVFNPRHYGSSVLAPSLGDLLLNILCVAIVAFYIANTFHRAGFYYWMLRQPRWVKVPLSIAIAAGGYGVFYACLLELNSIYEKSQFTLDITLSITFPTLKIACLLIFVLISTTYFLVLHVLASLFIRLNVTFGWGLLWFLLGTALAGAGMWTYDPHVDYVFALHGLYFLILYSSRFPRTLYSFRYKTTIYLSLGALTCAALSTYVVFNQENQKDIVNKKLFGKQLLAENDDLGEFLLNKIHRSIAADSVLRGSLSSDTLLARERIQQRIKSVHIDKYFDRYDVEVLSFDANGLTLDNQLFASEYSYFAGLFRHKRYQTRYEDLYFINDAENNFATQYVTFVDIPGKGHIILNMKLRPERMRGLYPDMLVGRQFNQAPETRAYSFALYNRQQRVLHSSGDYNYQRRLPVELLADSTLYREGVLYNAYKHVAQRGRDGRMVVVSSKEYPLTYLVSNFSFLYLVLIVYVLAVILAYAVRYRFSHSRLNYATKTQILLNIAFFLPLLLIVVITLSVISSNFDSNQERNYVDSSKNIGSNFLPYLQAFLNGHTSKAYMEDELRKMARSYGVDINLYTPAGKLWTSTQPLVFESGHLSKFINPDAYAHLIEDKENQILLNESLGTKQFRTAYAAVKTFDGQLLAVIGVPHYDSILELDRQLIEIIATVLSVFTVLLLIFVFVSYWASTILTKPLRMLTHKLRRTNLDKLNEPIQWQSDDEIGLLIGEYNRMLIKLEENKRALSQSEKQSAWREMAKQVAHEIKNPLTPMKLTLQHLQRTLPPDNTPSRRVIQRALNSLLDQIDNLSDIATSFSDFAKMPLPKNELFEITTVINKAADLYADDGKISLLREVAPYPVMVVGDRQLIGRILTNLIINGIQSVPTDRKPMIRLRLVVSEGNVNIEVSDNGSGIPEMIRAKVFLPNFSTKQGGSGLGLAIAKRGVEHAGGSIWFETEEGEGTTFFVSIPVADATDSVGLLNGKSKTITV